MNNLKLIRQILGMFFSTPWYPVVYGIYPVLALLSANIGEVRATAGIRSAFVSLSITLIIFGLLFLILRNVYRSAFLSLLWLALFFSYGHIHILLVKKFPAINFVWGLSGIWLVLAIFFYWWATRPSINFVNSVSTLNVIALGLAIVSWMQISLGFQEGGARSVAAENAPVENLNLPENPPDIYYFILDMYAREDLLKSAYGYDNSGFINALRERGFYVAECSQSNYTRTELSLASSLNMSYLQDLDPKFTQSDKIGRLHLWDTLKHSAARYNLEQIGYQTVSYSTGYAWSELDDADVFMVPASVGDGMNEFETLFLQTTWARLTQDLGWLNVDQVMAQNYRDRHMRVFNSMAKVVKIPGPKFVYVHLILPHPPFVFGPEGEYTDPADFWNEEKLYPVDLFQKGYTNQVTYLNSRILETVDTIISGSPTPPILVLQGDHGPWSQPNPEHFMILNAYYLPGHEDKLYSRISPVNTFRTIFDAYFGAKYDMLPDVSYYSPVPKLYNFSKISYPCP